MSKRAGKLVLGDGRIDAEVVAQALGPAGPARAVVVPRPTGDPVAALVGTSLREVKSQLLAATLRHCGGNRTKTAELLGIGVRTLFNKLQPTR